MGQGRSDGLIDVSGSLMSNVSQKDFVDTIVRRPLTATDYLITSSLDTVGNINFRNLEERNRYNNLLLGKALRSEVGQETVLDGNLTARPPSWTQHHTGKNYSFVISAYSSSMYENTSLNAYRSGSESLEIGTINQASGTMYYQKNDRFVHAIYKMTASLGVPGNSNKSQLAYHFPESGSHFVINPGIADGNPSERGFEPQNSVYKTYIVNVPDYGIIRDIRIWVEVIKDHNAYSGSTGMTLGDLFLGIRSPNTSFDSGYPLYNDTKIKDQLNTTNAPFTGNLKSHYRNTYVLWDGTGLPLNEPRFPSWNSDYSIRTIFSDSSKVYNPRHYNKLFASGSSDHQEYLIGQESPSWTFTGVPYHSGANVAWISDVRALAAADSQGAAGSPPEGWLTGGGGEPAEKEFDTTGSNYGPATIKPVYPLLCDVTEIRPSFSGSVRLNKNYQGFRPGLRGTQIHGDWELVIGQNYDNPAHTDGYCGYFRQFRLEFIYEKNVGPRNVFKNKFEKKNISYVKNKSPRRLFILSCSYNKTFNTTPDANVHALNEVYEANREDQYGMTLGITDNTSSLYSDDFAVFTRITGSLVSKMGLSVLNNLFLNNEFGTPYIPLSSGSGEDVVSQILQTFDINTTKNNFSNIMEVKPLVGNTIYLRSVLSNKNITKTTAERHAELTSGSV